MLAQSGKQTHGFIFVFFNRKRVQVVMIRVMQKQPIGAAHRHIPFNANASPDNYYIITALFDRCFIGNYILG